MIGWYTIKFQTNGWDENKDIICNTIKPTVEELEKSNDITNFFFLEYYGNGEQKVTFVFYGDKERVLEKLNQFREVKEEMVDNYKPESEAYRFGKDYMLGVKLFELASRLAFCSIDNKNPIDKSSGQEIPIILILRHVFLQNLGYSTQEELTLSQHFDPCLLHFHQLCRNTKIK